MNWKVKYGVGFFLSLITFAYLLVFLIDPNWTRRHLIEANNQFLALEINGIVLKKEKVASDQNNTYIWLSTKNIKDTLAVIVPYYSPELYLRAEVGDSISKPNKSSVCNIYRNQKFHRTATLIYDL